MKINRKKSLLKRQQIKKKKDLKQIFFKKNILKISFICFFLLILSIFSGSIFFNKSFQDEKSAHFIFTEFSDFKSLGDLEKQNVLAFLKVHYKTSDLFALALKTKEEFAFENVHFYQKSPKQILVFIKKPIYTLKYQDGEKFFLIDQKAAHYLVSKKIFESNQSLPFFVSNIKEKDQIEKKISEAILIIKNLKDFFLEKDLILISSDSYLGFSLSFNAPTPKVFLGEKITESKFKMLKVIMEEKKQELVLYESFEIDQNGKIFLKKKPPQNFEKL